MVEGLGREVLPQPYQQVPRPTPRRIGEAGLSLFQSAAEARARAWSVARLEALGF